MTLDVVNHENMEDTKTNAPRNKCTKSPTKRTRPRPFIPSAELLLRRDSGSAEPLLVWASGSKSLIVHVLFLERYFNWLRLKTKKKKKGVEVIWFRKSTV